MTTKQYAGIGALAWAAWRIYNSHVESVSATIGGFPASVELTGPTEGDQAVTVALIVAGVLLVSL